MLTLLINFKETPGQSIWIVLNLGDKFSADAIILNVLKKSSHILLYEANKNVISLYKGDDTTVLSWDDPELGKILHLYELMYSGMTISLSQAKFNDVRHRLKDLLFL